MANRNKRINSTWYLLEGASYLYKNCDKLYWTIGLKLQTAVFHVTGITLDIAMTATEMKLMKNIAMGIPQCKKTVNQFGVNKLKAIALLLDATLQLKNAKNQESACMVMVVKL